jgi:hypothetical protein
MLAGLPNKQIISFKLLCRLNLPDSCACRGTLEFPCVCFFSSWLERSLTYSKTIIVLSHGLKIRLIGRPGAPILNSQGLLDWTCVQTTACPRALRLDLSEDYGRLHACRLIEMEAVMARVLLFT